MKLFKNFTTKRRIKAVNRRITRIQLELNLRNPYGYGDPMELYRELEYWEYVLEALIHKYELKRS